MFAGGDLRRVPLLRALDLSANNIRRLHADVFADNVHLRTIQLSRNPLLHLMPECFRGLRALRRLSLAFVPSSDVRLAPNAFRFLVAGSDANTDLRPKNKG